MYLQTEIKPDNAIFFMFGYLSAYSIHTHCAIFLQSSLQLLYALFPYVTM